MPPPMARMSLGCIRVWPLRGYSGLPSCSTGQRRELHGVRCRARRTWGCQLAVASCSMGRLGICNRPAATPSLRSSCRRLMSLQRTACWAARCWTNPARSLARSLASGAWQALPAAAPMSSVMVVWLWGCSNPRSSQLARMLAFLLQRLRGQTCFSKRSTGSCLQVCRARPSVQDCACQQLTSASPWLCLRSETEAAAPMPAPSACLWRPGTQCLWLRAWSLYRPLRPASLRQARRSCRAWGRQATPLASASHALSCTAPAARAALHASSAICASLARRSAAGKRSSSV
mmetsp:Transcript_47219/g.146318  ORF Transcript_47219/g.146318 Transcript_47219/m.146318 type:complete len:289 (+) Transcript_47219:448-1314(+)